MCGTAPACDVVGEGGHRVPAHTLSSAWDISLDPRNSGTQFESTSIDIRKVLLKIKPKTLKYCILRYSLTP